MGSAAKRIGRIDPEERLLVVGTGALACLFAARLSASGQPVGMLGSWRQALAALQARGVGLTEGENACRYYPVAASPRPEDFAGTRQAIVLVKTWQTRRAAQQLAACLSADGLALSLQNGLGNLEILAGEIGIERSAAGVTTLGAAVLEPGCARTAGSGEVILGQHPRLAGLERALGAAGFDVRVETDITALLWGKLVINTATNPISALLGITNGEMLERPETAELVRAAACEAAAVATALGISLPYLDAAQRVQEILLRTSPNRSSMLQDLERGAPTEIEAITGEVLRAAGEAGIDAPVNRTLYLLVKARRDFLQH